MPRDLGNLIWPRASDSPRGHVSGADGLYVTARATTASSLVFVFAQIAWTELWPGDRYHLLGPGLVSIAVFVGMALLGYLHYRSRGNPPAPPAAWRE